jgi:D-glycero-alpha-D-manno-heptose 1-phosphate guanylyltransferase
MKAIILSGGFGTRLRDIVSDVPKPMAPINGKPFLAILIEYLKKQGITEVILAIGYLKEKIIDYFKNEYQGIIIKYSIEQEPLGTGGAIYQAFDLIKDDNPVFILNGDTFCELDYNSMYENHNVKKSKFSIGLRRVPDVTRYGGVEIDENNIIKRYKEKNKDKSQIQSGLINSGIYLINKSLFNDFNLDKKFSFETDFMQKYTDKLRPLGFITNGYFIDIGIPEEYYKFCKDIKH